MFDINEYLSTAGNNLPSISDVFGSGSNEGDVSVVSATGNPTSISDTFSGVGDSLKSFVAGIGDSIGGLLGGILSPVTGEINTILLFILIAIVAIVFIIAYYGENIGHFFKGVFVA